MMAQFRRFSGIPAVFAAILVLASSSTKLLAVSCTMQSQMTDDQRNALLDSSRKIVLAVQSGNVDGVRALTIPSVAAHFEGISKSIQTLSPIVKNASITVDDVYGLDASDLTTATNAQFFCSSATASSLHVEISIPQLPPGKYALALVHATGVEHPQQMGLILSGPTDWKLAGFFFKPMAFNGHDSVWYWKAARQFARKGQTWNAHFYYQIADDLAVPVSFLMTPNLQKLRTEQAAVEAEGIPDAGHPLTLTSGGETYSVTDVHPDDALGSMDLVVNYAASDTSDPVATRSKNLAVMKALLALRPGLREGFHGLWVFANAPGQRPFGIEQAMSEIP